MIDKRTVIVLGAGASCPYGFPSGEGLKNQICQDVEFGTRSSLRTSLADLGFNEEHWINFGFDLRRSGRQSVDHFLEGRPEFLEVGKASIAYLLTQCEDEDAFYYPKDEGKDWYREMYNKLFPSFHPLDEDMFSIITFNYDRSLEQYLFTALQSGSKKSDDECRRLVESVHILHVHGRLGYLPWMSENGRSYVPHPSTEELRIAISGIQIATEITEGERTFERAKERLREAEQVVFIGFGYDRTNLQRLGLPDLFRERRDRRVYGSAKDLTDPEARSALNLIWDEGYRKGRIHIDNKNGEALDFVRHHAVFG